jgi:hypothetical protein
VFRVPECGHMMVCQAAKDPFYAGRHPANAMKTRCFQAMMQKMSSFRKKGLAGGRWHP